MNDSSSEEIDCAKLSCSELAARLRALGEDTTARLLGVDRPAKRAGLCSGFARRQSIEIDGSVGDFLFLLGAEANIAVRGNVGRCAGHSMVSGMISVHGNAGDYLAAYAKEGFVAVLGHAGDRCAQSLVGADVLVRSKVGEQAAYGMRGGCLVLGNGAGKNLGEGMSGGVIFVRGEVKSVAEHLRAIRLKDADAMRLSLLLVRAGIKADGADFKALRVRASQA